MKINFLDSNKFKAGLIPVTSTELKTRTGDFHPDGLFSEKIFGFEGTLERGKKYSYLDLNTEIIHPAAYKLLTIIDRRLKLFFSTETSFSLNSEGNLYQDEGGVSGISEFIKIFPKINFRGDTTERDKIIILLKEAYKNKTLFISILPIIPVDFRPMYKDEKGRLLLDNLNPIYTDILRKAAQVKSINEGSSLFSILGFYLQLSVNEHDEYIRKKIGHKKGLIRSTLLGKRIDFSARAVIIPGPQLDVNQVGVPLRIAVSLFEPFLIHYILFSKKYPFIDEITSEIKKYIDSDLSVDTIKRLIKSLRTGDKFPLKLKQLFWDATEIVMKNRVVLLKRDPALQDGSYRAFNPILVDGNSIQICTLQVATFNADFDGDTMALFHPLTKQAQAEAKEKMMRTVGSKNMSYMNYELSKEMIVGLYIMTKNIKYKQSPILVSYDDLEKAVDPYIPVKFRNQNTTMGKAIFNSVFPDDFEYIDKQITKKIVNSLMPTIIDTYGEETTNKIFSKLEKIGFKFATIMAPSITLDMIEMPDSILRIKQKIPGSSPEVTDNLINEAKKIMISHLKDTGLYDLIESGAGKGWDQPSQILIAKGVVADPKGNLLPPIEGSFSDGLKPTEYFSAASGARKGMADRALNTSTTGYFTRQLVYVLGPVEASPSNKDCKTKRTINLRLTQDIIKRIEGRFLLTNSGKLELFTRTKYKIGDVINLRSPIFCESHKICHTCYGNLLKRHKTPYVGILAGSLIGERGTQLIMRSFHTGGVATLTVHDILKDIENNDPLLNVNINNYFFQDETNLITKKECTINLNLEEYRLNDNIQINDDHIWVNHLVAKIEFGDTLFNLILDYPLHIQKKNMQMKKNEYINLNFLSNDIILEVPLQVADIKEQVNYVNRLLGGKVIYKDPSHMLNKVLGVYGEKISDLDLVHFEILVSQVLRDKLDQLLPARLGKTWNPIMMNIKSAVFQSGFIQGLAFENIGKAIQIGLIATDEIETSLLGRLVTGELK